MARFTEISTRNELADFLGIPRKKLTHILYINKPDSYYETFEIPKKSGGKRKISAPFGDLKSVQKKILKALYDHINECKQDTKCNISHAFEKGKGIISNARVHRNKRYVLNMDLENFFDSIHFGRVCGYFQKNNYFKLPYEVSVVLAQLLCYKKALPQGAPTSPMITNLICEILDMQLLKLAKKFKLDYTRYADDLTFSTNDVNFLNNYENFMEVVRNQICGAGFKINDKKTRVQYRDSRQTVTGLVTNKKLSVDRRYYKQVRAMADSLYQNGSYSNNGVEGTIGQLEGKFSFIDQLDRYNNIKDVEQQHSVFNLNGREKQYQKFLFYRYFFVSEKPVIVTEGKTDVKYLKAALKKLHTEYPELIEKSPDGHFEFKITFLKRSKRLKYFFGMSQDGADAMKNLFNFFVDKNPKFKNYYKELCNASGGKPLNPVVLIFDNELSNKNKPISSFVSHADIKGKKREMLEENLVVEVVDDGNLFLVTNPLVQEENECEIEDLFDESTISHTIGGKTFSKNDKADKEKHYGKEIFANYIQSNYQNINFENFKPILNNISKIVTEYARVTE